MFKLIFISLISLNLYASYPELFGTNWTTSSIAGQADFNTRNSSNNYYIPAIVAFTDKKHFAASIYHTLSNMESIKNVIVENEVSSDTTNDEFGDVNTNIKSYNSMAINSNFPTESGVFSVSVFAPIGDLMQINTGNAYRPEYVIYNARYRRLQTHFNFSRKLNSSLAFSFGAHMGLKTELSLGSKFVLSSTADSSNASIDAKVKPTFAGVVSIIKIYNDKSLYFTFQQEMKSKLNSNLEVDAIAIGSFPINSALSSIIFYDPHILRIGFSGNYLGGILITSAEYQLWSNFKSPVVRINENQALLNTLEDSVESHFTVETKDIVLLKLGFIRDKFRFGYAFRPSPIDGDISGSGNTIDNDTHIFSGGFGRVPSIDSWGFGLSIQYHLMSSKTITKTAGRENGANGLKIGSPRYKVGGNIISASIGFSKLF